MPLNIENINYDEFKNICRTCMCNCDVKFTPDCAISDVFHKLTDIHFETNDELPQQICLKCFEKMNEIHAFVLQSKQTNSSLTQWLINFKNSRLKQEQDVTENTNIQKMCEVVMLGKNFPREEPKVELDKNLNLSNEYVIDELKIKQEIEEETNDEFNEVMIPETNEFINEQNANCFEHFLLKPNTSDIKDQNEESNNNSNHNDSSNSSGSSNIVSAGINTKESNKNKDKPYKCDVCNKTYICLVSFKRHKNLPSCERSYECDQCSKSYAQLSNLKQHIRTHSGERPFECDQCSKSFTRSIDLKNHMRTHSGERPYICKQCSKTFSVASHLNRHMRTHSGERPHKCNQCSKTFTQSNSLKTHMRWHNGERPYICTQCSKSFNQSTHLKRHMRTHENYK